MPISTQQQPTKKRLKKTPQKKGWSPPPKALGGACLALANQTCGAVATAGHRGQCETCINTYRKTLFNETGSCAGSALKAEWCPAFVPVTKACEIAANKSCGSAQHRMANRAACTTCVEAHATELYAAGCPTDGKPLYNYSIELCEEAPKRPDPYVSARRDSTPLPSYVQGNIRHLALTPPLPPSYPSYPFSASLAILFFFDFMLTDMMEWWFW